MCRFSVCRKKLLSVYEYIRISAQFPEPDKMFRIFRFLLFPPQLFTLHFFQAEWLLFYDNADTFFPCTLSFVFFFSHQFSEALSISRSMYIYPVLNGRIVARMF